MCNEEAYELKYLLFSDLHGMSKLGKLLSFIGDDGCDVAFGLGDYGSIHNSEFSEVFSGLCGIEGFRTLYGNHDDMNVIQSSSNWMPDGLNVVGGLRVFCVNGIWGTRVKDKPWHHTVASMIKLMPDVGEVDLLLTHEHPFGLDYHTAQDKFKFFEGRDWHSTFAKAVKEYLNPNSNPHFLWAYGHSYSIVADRVIPELGLRTIGLDGRYVMLNSKWEIVKVEEINHEPY